MRQITLILSAAGFISAGILVLLNAGLPDRAATVGYFIPGVALPVAPEIGGLAPPIEATALDGEPVSLWGLRGRPVIINFWATWCAPCLAEMPDLQALYDEYAASGLRILAVNLGESPSAMGAWVDRFGLTFDIVPDPVGEIVRAYPRYGPPGTYLIAPDGVVTRIDYGPVNVESLRADVARLLGDDA